MVKNIQKEEIIMCTTMITKKEIEERIRQNGIFDLNMDELKIYYYSIVEKWDYVDRDLTLKDYVELVDEMRYIGNWFAFKKYPVKFAFMMIDQWAEDYPTYQILYNKYSAE